MDIGHNLFYNENAVHSGDFLEERTGFGEETMRKLIRTNILIWLACILLCGCTRREQLVLENLSSGQEEESEAAQSVQKQDESVEPVIQAEAAGQQSGTEQNLSAQETSAGNGEQQTIYVHVCGAVESPDVYELPVDSRVYEAVLAAGGFTEDADSNYVNQAQRLSDGVKLVIPTKEQTEAFAEGNGEEMTVGIVREAEGFSDAGISGTVQDGTAEQALSDGKVNINTASETELCNIPGIGAVRAAAIVAYRQEKGGFAAIEDIMNVSGIKEGTYEKIKDHIKIK